jgi:hypothetical protein
MIYISSNNDRPTVTKNFTLLHYTSGNFTSLHLTTLSFGLTNFKFPTALFHFTSLHFIHLTSLHFRRFLSHFYWEGVPFSTVHRTPAQQAGMLPWHWPCHERRGYRIITVVLTKHKNGSLMMVPTWTETCRSDLGIFNCFNIPVILWLCASLWNNKSALMMGHFSHMNEPIRNS